jgi:uncharacterized membrane protein
MTTIKLPTVSQTLKTSWDLYKQTWDMWILGALAALVASFFIDASFFIATLFGMLFALHLLHGKNIHFFDLMKEISLYKIFRFSIASIVFGLFMILGFILLIIPGIYIAIRYGYFPFRYAMREDMTMEDVYYEIKGITKKVLTKYFVLNVLTALILIFITVLTLGIGLVVTAPLGIISSAYIYNVLFGHVHGKKELE